MKSLENCTFPASFIFSCDFFDRIRRKTAINNMKRKIYINNAARRKIRRRISLFRESLPPSFLSELEAGYVNTWSTLPLYARSSATLTSFKVTYGSEQYIPLMGYGGIRYMTFNFTDSEWSQKVASCEINADLYKQ